MYSCRHIPVWLLSLARRRALQQRAESISGMSADDESNSNRKQKLTSVMFSGTKYADINYISHNGNVCTYGKCCE